MASSDVAGATLFFDPSDHTYWEPPGRDVGRRIPSVTEILRATGVSYDFSAAHPADLEFARQLGTAVHRDAHAADDNDLVIETVDPRVRPYLEAWLQAREALHLMPLTRERLVYHRALGYCGTLDGIFVLPTGRRVLIDLKTGDPDAGAAQFQTAAYQAAYVFEHPDEAINERWAIQLCPENAIPYRVHQYADWLDFRKFQAFLATFNAQYARRRKVA